MDHAETVQHAAEGAHEAAGHVAGHGHDPTQYILHHVADGNSMEVPFGSEHLFATDLYFKDEVVDGTLHHGLFGKGWLLNVGGTELDLTPTKYTLMLWTAALLVMGVLWWTTRNRKAVPRGRAQTVVETLFLFVRDEIAEKAIGHHDGRRYTPYLATCFFFILGINFLGLVPYASTATGSISVTVVFATMTFLVTQLAGMRAQGVGGYWAHLVPSGVPLWLYPLMLPIEIIGLFTKPFALTMRLFANMVAGHIVLFFILGLVFFLKSPLVGFGSVPLAFGIFLLETFVAMVQAYVFTLLSAVFIGMASHAH